MAQAIMCRVGGTPCCPSITKGKEQGFDERSSTVARKAVSNILIRHSLLLVAAVGMKVGLGSRADLVTMGGKRPFAVGAG